MVVELVFVLGCWLRSLRVFRACRSLERDVVAGVCLARYWNEGCAVTNVAFL